ncbi:MAG: tryptophan--tRNA ligase [Anaerolineaceae bacterium]|nr:tryptophan--tRNA ligase [Anaerolineaceae bacterium]
MKQRVLSGIQPSGQLTIGNYLGALRHWVRVSQDFDCHFTIVDLHAITVPQDPAGLREGTREITALFLAAGIDPQHSVVFAQSHVVAHSELAWLLTCMTPLGWLHRMTQFKDKVGREQMESVGAGLLNYPVLMAGDILLYQAHAVPVGEDQRQHLEFTRDLAQRFNHRYGPTFRIPTFFPARTGAKIMGLDDPTKKMSKSEESDHHALLLLDPPDLVAQKIKRAVTDNFREIRFSDDPERAGVNNLLTLYQAFTDEESETVEARFDGKGYGELKREVAEVINENLAPLQARYREMVSDRAYIDEVLRDGAQRASAIADATLADVKQKIGLLAPAAK